MSWPRFPKSSHRLRRREYAGFRRRVIAGTTIGNALEFFDFTVFSFSDAVHRTVVFPRGVRVCRLLLTTATFGVGFLMRPVGALLIGSYADRFGRRSAMTLTLFLMGLGCGMMALTPTYGQIGFIAPLVIVLARLIQGFAAGGEVGAATTLLVEHAPPSQRALTPVGNSAVSRLACSSVRSSLQPWWRGWMGRR